MDADDLACITSESQSETTDRSQAMKGKSLTRFSSFGPSAALVSYSFVTPHIPEKKNGTPIFNCLSPCDSCHAAVAQYQFFPHETYMWLLVHSLLQSLPWLHTI